MSLVAIAATLILLAIATDLGPASRRVLEHPQRIAIGPEGHKRLASDYASGVLAMKRAADDELRGIALPAATLALLASLGLFRSSRKATTSEERVPKE